MSAEISDATNVAWSAAAYDRHGPECRKLLNLAYDALFSQSVKFRRALLATQNATLKHSIGNTDSFSTVLTPREFCRRLTALRSLTKNTEE